MDIQSRKESRRVFGTSGQRMYNGGECTTVNFLVSNSKVELSLCLCEWPVTGVTSVFQYSNGHKVFCSLRETNTWIYFTHVLASVSLVFSSIQVHQWSVEHHLFGYCQRVPLRSVVAVGAVCGLSTALCATHQTEARLPKVFPFISFRPLSGQRTGWALKTWQLFTCVLGGRQLI